MLKQYDSLTDIIDILASLSTQIELVLLNKKSFVITLNVDNCREKLKLFDIGLISIWSI